jgi:hypothetical protein
MAKTLLAPTPISERYGKIWVTGSLETSDGPMVE